MSLTVKLNDTLSRINVESEFEMFQISFISLEDFTFKKQLFVNSFKSYDFRLKMLVCILF